MRPPGVVAWQMAFREVWRGASALRPEALPHGDVAGRLLEVALELREGAADVRGWHGASEHYVGRLVAVAGDAHHDWLVARDRAALDERARSCQRCASGRLREHAFRLGEQLDGRQDLLVGDLNART